jgi:hypothetical protein
MPLRRSTEVTPTAGDGDEPESTAPREQRADLQTPGSSSEHPERLRQFAFFRLSSEEYISDPYERGRIAWGQTLESLAKLAEPEDWVGTDSAVGASPPHSRQLPQVHVRTTAPRGQHLRRRGGRVRRIQHRPIDATRGRYICALRQEPQRECATVAVLEVGARIRSSHHAAVSRIPGNGGIRTYGRGPGVRLAPSSQARVRTHPRRQHRALPAGCSTDHNAGSASARPRSRLGLEACPAQLQDGRTAVVSAAWGRGRAVLNAARPLGRQRR